MVCDSNLEEHDVETTPCLIVEILSASTRQTDLMHKSSDYQNLPSLQGYLIVDSQQQEVSLHRRTKQGWQIEMIEDSVDLPCLDVNLSVAEIYARTQVPMKEWKYSYCSLWLLHYGYLLNCSMLSNGPHIWRFAVQMISRGGQTKSKEKTWLVWLICEMAPK